MSTLTVADVKIRVKRKFGDEAGVQLTDADVLRMVNDAQRTIAGRNDSILEKTAVADSLSGVQEYSLPADILKFKFMSYKGIAYPAFNPMQGMTVNELNMYIDSWDANLSTKGIPAVYAIHASKFLVYPIPQDTITGAFKIYYTRAPTDMVNDTDVLDLPQLYHTIVVDLVLQDAYEMDEDWNAAQAKSAQNNTNMDRLRADDEWTKRDTYPLISVRLEDI